MDAVTARRHADLLSVGSFVALGLPDGMLGAAWPAMRRSLDAPVAGLGFVLLVSTAGSVLVTVGLGRLLRRTGVAAALATGSACAAAAAAGVALAPRLAVVLAVAALFGLAAGVMDGGLNTTIGLSGRRRLLNLLHGAYGVGTAVGPLIVTVAVLTGSWRIAYLVLSGVDVALGVLWVRQRAAPDALRSARTAPRSQGRPAQDQDRQVRTGPPPAGGRSSPRRGVLGSVIVFFLYAGLEVSAGQWEATFARFRLHLTATDAGLATFGYWAMLTAVRLGLGVLHRPVASRSVVRWGSLLAMPAAALVWAQPTATAAVAGFCLLGGFLAGVFPALVDLTPARVGATRARHVIAWQVGAAAAGGASMSAALGLLVGATGLWVVGPALTGMALALAAIVTALDRVDRRGQLRWRSAGPV